MTGFKVQGEDVSSLLVAIVDTVDIVEFAAIKTRQYGILCNTCSMAIEYWYLRIVLVDLLPPVLVFEVNYIHQMFELRNIQEMEALYLLRNQVSSSCKLTMEI